MSQNTIREVTNYVMDRTEKPAVGGIPPQKSVTNSRMAYLSNREVGPPKQKKQTLASVRSQEGQVFERLPKQAEIYQNLKKEKKDLVEGNNVDP